MRARNAGDSAKLDNARVWELLFVLLLPLVGIWISGLHPRLVGTMVGVRPEMGGDIGWLDEAVLMVRWVSPKCC